jgi:hypothetical protein
LSSRRPVVRPGASIDRYQAGVLSDREPPLDKPKPTGFKTTQGYIDLAGETFRDEADLLERRLWGGSGTKNRYQVEEPSPVEATAE